MSKINFPHFYKKGKIVKIKTLDEDTEKKEYVFSAPAAKSGVQTIINHCNNLNQIVARCLLQTSKMTHYFGISKDISMNVSKNKIHFNQFKTILAANTKNDFVKKDLEKLFETIETQNKLTLKLTQTIEKHSILLEKTLKNNLFIEEHLKRVNMENILKETDAKIGSVQELLKVLIG